MSYDHEQLPLSCLLNWSLNFANCQDLFSWRKKVVPAPESNMIRTTGECRRTQGKYQNSNQSSLRTCIPSSYMYTWRFALYSLIQSAGNQSIQRRHRDITWTSPTGTIVCQHSCTSWEQYKHSKEVASMSAVHQQLRGETVERVKFQLNSQRSYM